LSADGGPVTLRWKPVPDAHTFPLVKSRSLRVGIDAHAIGSRLGGNESYIRGLIQALSGHPCHEYIVYVTDEEAAAIVAKLCPAAQTRLMGHQGALVRLGFTLSRLCARDGIDVLHTQYVAPVVSPPIVVMIHDLSFRHHPEWYTRGEKLRFEMTVPWTGRRAKRILTVSEFSRRDIVESLRVREEKVVVTYNRINSIFARQAADRTAETLERLGIRRGYVLALGNLQPRKNLPLLIRAWQELRASEADFAPRLVIVGKKAWMFDDVIAASRESGFADEITLTDYVAEEDLPSLYSGAEFCVYPSLFEGFGLPPLEAMACGTPVITSNTTALPEVCGDAAEYIDPTSAEDLKRAMLRLHREPALRAERVAAGLRRAAIFQAYDPAIPTIAAYEEAALS
jgi:glycosyltransferase involved in cell wall biosynthesis